MVKTQPYIDNALVYEGDACLLWPYARNNKGRAKICRKGRVIMVHRLICETINGPAHGREATHSCGNGHLGCVTKSHIRWQTHAENMAEMVAHGRSTRGKNAKLNPGQVIQIRALHGSLSQEKIAAKFNVGHSIVSSIIRGEKWAWL